MQCLQAVPELTTKFPSIITALSKVINDWKLWNDPYATLIVRDDALMILIQQLQTRPELVDKFPAIIDILIKLINRKRKWKELIVSHIEQTFKPMEDNIPQELLNEIIDVFLRKIRKVKRGEKLWQKEDIKEFFSNILKKFNIELTVDAIIIFVTLKQIAVEIEKMREENEPIELQRDNLDIYAIRILRKLGETNNAVREFLVMEIQRGNYVRTLSHLAATKPNLIASIYNHTSHRIHTAIVFVNSIPLNALLQTCLTAATLDEMVKCLYFVSIKALVESVAIYLEKEKNYHRLYSYQENQYFNVLIVSSEQAEVIAYFLPKLSQKIMANEQSVDELITEFRNLGTFQKSQSNQSLQEKYAFSSQFFKDETVPAVDSGIQLSIKRNVADENQRWRCFPKFDEIAAELKQLGIIFMEPDITLRSQNKISKFGWRLFTTGSYYCNLLAIITFPDIRHRDNAIQLFIQKYNINSSATNVNNQPAIAILFNEKLIDSLSGSLELKKKVLR